MDECLILVLLDQGEDALIGDTELKAAEETLGGGAARGGQAGLQVLDDVAWEHLEIKQEVLLTAKYMKISLGAIQRVQEEWIYVWVGNLYGKDLLTCLLGM